MRTHVPFCLPKDLVLQAERTQPLPIVSTRCIRHDASDQLAKPQPYQQMPSAATKMHLEIHSFRTFVRGSACQTTLPFDTIYLPAGMICMIRGWACCSHPNVQTIVRMLRQWQRHHFKPWPLHACYCVCCSWGWPPKPPTHSAAHESAIAILS